jgi:Secretion system C-terminal sorting domain
MVDLDGTSAYSKIIALNTENAENSIGQIYPNPSNGEAKVSISTKESGDWTVKTFDITGKLISKETINLQKGVNNVELKNLGTGLNYIQMTDGKTTEVRKALKQ